MAFSLTRTPGVSPALGELGPLRVVSADLNVSSYTNPNGETLDPLMFGMKFILGVVAISAPRGFVYNYTYNATAAQSKLTIAQDNGVATAAALPEIPNSTNHGTVRFLIIGV